MSKREYIAISNALSKLLDSKEKMLVVALLSEEFSKLNPRFSITKFVVASYYHQAQWTIIEHCESQTLPLPVKDV